MKEPHRKEQKLSWFTCTISISRDAQAALPAKLGEEEADAIILGSPIYFGVVTGEMRSFMERLAKKCACRKD